MTVTLTPLIELLRPTGHPDFVPSLHPRGPDGRFTHSFARLMTDDQRGHARRQAAAFKPKQGINTPDGARAYLSSIGSASPAATTYFSGGHVEVNQALRAGNDNYPGIKAMDAEMKPLPDDIIVTRRVPARSLGDATPEQLLNFRTADAGYTAASVATMPSGPDDVLMHIAVPKGTKAAINPDTGAIVLDRGLEMSVLHVARNEHGGKDMFLIATPHGDGKDGGLPNLDAPNAGRDSSRADVPNAPGGNAPDGRVPGGAGRPNTDAPAAPPTEPNRGDAAPGLTSSGSRSGGGEPSDSVLQRATSGASDEPMPLAAADPELRTAMHGAFDATFGNLSASLDDSVSQVYMDGDGRTVVRAEGYIRNKDGKIVGSFRRMLYPDTGEVHNDTLALSGSEQGSGFAQQFAQHTEPELAKLGLTHATVSATDVGGYAWRRYGWAPDNPAAAGDVPSRLRSVTGGFDLSPEDKATVSNWLKAFEQPDQSKWPTPSEIGDFGKGKYTRKDDAGRDLWPGKAVLVGSSWQGQRDLNTGQASA